MYYKFASRSTRREVTGQTSPGFTKEMICYVFLVPALWCLYGTLSDDFDPLTHGDLLFTPDKEMFAALEYFKAANQRFIREENRRLSKKVILPQEREREAGQGDVADREMR